MQLSKEHPIHKMGKRARAIIEATELHYRAEMAEVLLSEPREYKKNPEGKPSVAEAFSNLIIKMDGKRREELVEHLFSADLVTRAFTKSDERYLKRLVEPNSEVKMVDRTNLPVLWAEILKPDKEFKLTDPDDVQQYVHEIVRDFYPSMPLSDGRPEDAEPGEPPADETENPILGPVPVPFSRLRFVVDKVTCRNSTREMGADEINYSGVATEGPLATYMLPSAVGATRMAIRNAGQFRTFDEVVETGRGPMHVYDLAGHSFPRLFVVQMAMAEIDDGGFEAFMDMFEDNLLAELTTDWETAVGLVIGTTVTGGLLGALGGPIGAAIGAAVGLGAGLGTVLFYFVTGWDFGNQDDMFDFQSALLVLENGSLDQFPFNGNRISEIQTLTHRIFLANGGESAKYYVDYHWELIGGTTFQTQDDQD